MLLLLYLLQVRCIRWSPDDSRLISCSMDGAVYEWNVQECKREGESVLKSCSYTSLALTPDLRTTFAVGSDCTLKEIILAESNVREGGREGGEGRGGSFHDYCNL